MESGQVVLERETAAGATARQEAVTALLPGIDAALKEAGWDKHSLSCLVVGQGPGSFTGIRTAIVTARTLAQALMLPLIGVCYLECLARAAGAPVAVVLAGSKGNFFAAAYSYSGEPGVAPAYVGLSELTERLGAWACWIADEASSQLLASHGRLCEPLPELKNIAVIQAQIAWDRLSLRVPDRLTMEERRKLADEFTWRHVEPLYLRAPSVTVKKSHAN
jgi:tRNA threonylcarbamoyl adenosine modification protein YeaZ